MSTLQEVITDIAREVGEKGQVIRSWRITGKGAGKGYSGSDQDDPLGEADRVAAKLPAGEYSLWVTDAVKQLYSSKDGLTLVRKFVVSDYTEAGVTDDRLSSVLADNRMLRGRISELQGQYDTLQKTLTETSTQHAKAIAAASDGVAKTLEASVKGLEGLAEGHVSLLGSSRELLVATASDARDQTLKDKANGLWNRFFDPIIDDLARDFGGFAKEVLPMAPTFLKWMIRAIPKAGEGEL